MGEPTNKSLISNLNMFRKILGKEKKKMHHERKYLCSLCMEY